jgi:hypothetical protein
MSNYLFKNRELMQENSALVETINKQEMIIINLKEDVRRLEVKLEAGSSDTRYNGIRDLEKMDNKALMKEVM